MIICKDIAAMVGVSRQAVTAVLNNSRPNCVSKEKCAEILKIAAEHNYHPNAAAVTLRTGKSNLIGVVMPAWDNLYVAELCMAIQRCLAAKNYTPFFTIDNQNDDVSGNANRLVSLHVDGIITVAASILPDNIGVPVVSYYYDDPRFDSVCPDFELDSRLLIHHLKDCGHKKIGYLGWVPDQRFRFLVSEAEKCGLEFPARWQVNCSNSNCETAFDRLLKQNQKKDLPTALIIHNDAIALRLMHRIRERNFRIPEDISIIGHDNISYCGSAFPPLTSVSFGTPDEIAEILVDLLMERIKNRNLPRKKALLKSKLNKRESITRLKNKTSCQRQK